MKITLRFLLLIALVVPFQSWAQENRLYSQYMFNMLSVNPAYAGNQYQFSATALNRAQWTGVEGAPVTQALSVHYRANESVNGLGLLVNHDKIGIHNNTQIFGSYSYHIQGQNFQLSFGLQAGIESLRSNYDELRLNDPIDPKLNGYANEIKPNFGAGIFLDNGKGYVGFSVPALLQNNKIELSETVLIRKPRYYILTAGKILDISKQVKFKPSFLLRYQQGNPISYDLNSTFIFNSRLFAGVSYRSGRSIVSLLQLQLNEAFRFGYAFDHTFNSLGPYGTGSHEVMVNYRINFSPAPCHTYY